ncbi:MAG: hypothetical protein Q7R91_00290 [bacterium]|nr:hypothetical protein [bacterium]
MVTERQKAILNAIVREYVSTAEPVSSGELVKKYRMPYSSATVRNELLSLDKEGLTLQPHTSAGRIPTDKGYRFFISENIPDKKADKKIEKSFRNLREIEDDFDFLRQASRMLAHFSGEFSMAGFSGKGMLYKSGIAEAFNDPEFADGARMHEFGELVDFLDEGFKNFFEPEDIKEPRVFIGEENPIREARNYTMIVSSAPTPFGEDGIFGILGPRRMDYNKNLALLRAMQKLFND